MEFGLRCPTWIMEGRLFIAHEKEGTRQELGLNQRSATLSRAGKRWETAFDSPLQEKHLQMLVSSAQLCSALGKGSSIARAEAAPGRSSEKDHGPISRLSFCLMLEKRARQVVAPQFWMRYQDRGTEKPGRTE